MQLALIRSHAAGVGEPLPDDVVRGTAAAAGPDSHRRATPASGVELPARLLELLDHDLLPVIPGKGSVGASGDLAQLAHLAQPLVGEGRLRRARRRRPARAAGGGAAGRAGRRAAGARARRRGCR